MLIIPPFEFSSKASNSANFGCFLTLSNFFSLLQRTSPQKVTT